MQPSPLQGEGAATCRQVSHRRTHLVRLAPISHRRRRRSQLWRRRCLPSSAFSVCPSPSQLWPRRAGLRAGRRREILQGQDRARGGRLRARLDLRALSADADPSHRQAHPGQSERHPPAHAGRRLAQGDQLPRGGRAQGWLGVRHDQPGEHHRASDRSEEITLRPAQLRLAGEPQYRNLHLRVLGQGHPHLDDLKKREIVFGSTGPASGSTVDARMLGALVGHQVQGRARLRPRSNDIRLASERGETDGFCGLLVSALKTDYWEQYKSGRMAVPVQMGLDKHRRARPTFPNAYELAKSEEDRQLFQLIFGPWSYGRPLLRAAGNRARPRSRRCARRLGRHAQGPGLSGRDQEDQHGDPADRRRRPSPSWWTRSCARLRRWWSRRGRCSAWRTGDGSRANHVLRHPEVAAKRPSKDARPRCCNSRAVALRGSAFGLAPQSGATIASLLACYKTQQEKVTGAIP